MTGVGDGNDVGGEAGLSWGGRTWSIWSSIGREEFGTLLGRADVVLWGGGERRCGRKMRNLLRRCGT